MFPPRGRINNGNAGRPSDRRCLAVGPSVRARRVRGDPFGAPPVSFALPPDTRFFTARMAKGAPLIGVATFYAPPLVDGEWLDRSPRFQCLLRTETTARMILMGDYIPVEIEGAFIRNVTPTTEANYRYLVSHAAYSTAHAPENPDAMPTEAIDFSKYVPF